MNRSGRLTAQGKKGENPIIASREYCSLFKV
jgi:hypothetical protein